MNAVRMNYLHLFNEYVVFLHPSAFHYAPLPNPSSWSCTSPQLHATLSAFHPCSLLSTLSAPYIFFGTGMKVLSGDGNVEAWRGTEKRKSCGEVKREGGKSQAVVHANDLNKYNIDSSWRILLFGINFWQPSPHSTLHSTLAPPSPHLHPTSPTISPFTSPFHPHPSTYFTPFLHFCPL